MTGSVPCHWSHSHGSHEWTPIVQDPEHSRILHVFSDAPVTCPGKPYLKRGLDTRGRRN